MVSEMIWWISGERKNIIEFGLSFLVRNTHKHTQHTYICDTHLDAIHCYTHLRWLYYSAFYELVWSDAIISLCPHDLHIIIVFYLSFGSYCQNIELGDLSMYLLERMLFFHRNVSLAARCNSIQTWCNDYYHCFMNLFSSHCANTIWVKQEHMK